MSATPFATAAVRGYFPAWPSGVRTSALVGTLTDYGIGTASGALVIRTAAGRTVRFAVAAPPFRINGRAIDCTVAPRDGAPPRSARVGRQTSASVIRACA